MDKKAERESNTFKDSTLHSAPTKISTVLHRLDTKHLKAVNDRLPDRAVTLSNPKGRIY